MEQSNQELLNRFNEVLKKLPPQERKKLYEYLSKMTPEQRSVVISKLVERYAPPKAASTNSQNVPTNTPSANSNVSSAANVHSSEPKNSEPQVKTAPSPVRVEKTTEETNRNEVDNKEVISPKRANSSNPPKRKKRLKKGVKVAITLIIVALVLIIAGVFAILNMDKVKAVLGISSETTVETTETSIEETAITETSIETTVETTLPEETEPPVTPGPTNVPVLPGAPDLTGLVIVLDPGHQEVEDETTEICAPWLSISKPRCTVGAFGAVTNTPEYDLTLQYCLIMKNYLEQCGATVLLTRDSNDVNMSNQERAMFAVVNEADLFIRVHCDSANDSEASGVRVYVPDSGDYTSTNVEMGDILGAAVAEAEGLTFDSTRATYLYTGLNYANTIPSFQISLGFLSNSDNEAILLNPDNELRVAEVIAVFCDNFTQE